MRKPSPLAATLAILAAGRPAVGGNVGVIERPPTGEELDRAAGLLGPSKRTRGTGLRFGNNRKVNTQDAARAKAKARRKAQQAQRRLKK